MLIGADYDKIEFELFGLELLEPNSFIGDFVIFAFSIYFGLKVLKLDRSHFIRTWNLFFFAFGIGFLFGGLGHLMYNYWEIPGKYIGWFAGLVTVYIIERAMIPYLSNQKTIQLLTKISKVKFLLAITAKILVIYFIDLEKDYSVAMRVTIINSAIGLIFSLGILGYVFSKKITPGFKYFMYSVLIMLPAAIFQSQKISIYPWFDKNDISHIFILFGLIFYYLGVKSVAKYEKELSNNR